MENLYFSFTVVFPLICLLGLGYTMALLKMHKQDFFSQVNALCFEIFLPTLLFINIYQSDFNLARSLNLVAYAVASVLVLVTILVYVIPFFVKERKDCGVVIQGIFRSNIVLFGVPVANSLYGAEGVSTLSILIAFVIPLYNVFAVLILQVYSNQRPNIGGVVKLMGKNPLIIASLLGFIFAGFEIKLPNMIESTLHSLANIVTPLALIALGGTFRIREMQKYMKSLTVSVLGKLVFVPMLFLSLSLLFPFTPIEFAALMAVYISPTALASFTMAQNMGSNGELAGEIVVLTSIASIFSIFLWLTVLQFMNLI